MQQQRRLPDYDGDDDHFHVLAQEVRDSRSRVLLCTYVAETDLIRWNARGSSADPQVFF